MHRLFLCFMVIIVLCVVNQLVFARASLMVILSEDDKKKLQSLVEAEDSKIKGAQSALVDAGLGEVIARKAAKAGDLIQYWYVDDTQWCGHAGIVEKIDSKGRAHIYGSHLSTLQSEKKIAKDERKGGIGSGPVFDLKSTSRKVYIVRWTAKAGK